MAALICQLRMRFGGQIYPEAGDCADAVVSSYCSNRTEMLMLIEYTLMHTSREQYMYIQCTAKYCLQQKLLTVFCSSWTSLIFY